MKGSNLDQPAQVLLLLLMVAGDHHRHGTKTVGLDGSHDTSAAIGHLLSDKTTVLVKNLISASSRTLRKNSPVCQGPCRHIPEEIILITIEYV